METALRNYVGGEWIESSATDGLPVTDPATGEVLGHIPLSTASDVDVAVSVARDAFRSWREVPPVVRARHLFKLQSLFEEAFEEIATTVTRENG